MFAFGIDPVDGGLPSDQPADWPSIPEVQKYVRRIRESLDERLAAISPSDSAGDGFSASTLLNVAIEHRLMHAETLAYMLHQLPLEAKIPPASQSQAVASRVNPAMIEIPAGRATLGLSRASGNFGWDNEFEEHSVEVPAFAIDKYKITNREYLEFLTSEGYENEEYWTDADWDWKTKQNITHPVFWRRMNGDWFLRRLIEIAAAAVMVSGPLRAATRRGETTAGLVTLLSAALLVSVLTFALQFVHPMIDPWAFGWAHLFALINTAAVCSGVGLAFWGIQKWRVEQIGKRLCELAEDALALAHEAPDIFDHVRSPVAFMGEGSSRKGNPNESTEKRDALNQAFVPIERDLPGFFGPRLA